jgi:NAD-dependent SIR2 family protein deacetylase
MQHIDGNALAGHLADLFTFDGTMAVIRCSGCGSVEQLATAMVYMDDMGAVARCVHCDNVLLTLVESEDRVWIGFAGVTAIEISKS